MKMLITFSVIILVLAEAYMLVLVCFQISWKVFDFLHFLTKELIKKKKQKNIRTGLRDPLKNTTTLLLMGFKLQEVTVIITLVGVEQHR